MPPQKTEYCEECERLKLELSNTKKALDTCREVVEKLVFDLAQCKKLLRAQGD